MTLEKLLRRIHVVVEVAPSTTIFPSTPTLEYENVLRGSFLEVKYQNIKLSKIEANKDPENRLKIKMGWKSPSEKSHKLCETASQKPHQ